VEPSASSADIVKAYRKKSITLHPDKNPGVKGSQERWARLGVIVKILREEGSRKRYDFFYKNGVPKWRGTGYYYSRFRPGLGSVLVFLAILSSGIQYAIQLINRRRDLQRIERFVRLGKAAAYGPKGIPTEGKRKVRVPLTELSEEANRGRMIDLLVDGSDVYMIPPGHEPMLLDESMTPAPRVRDTWVMSLLGTILSRLKITKSTVSEREREADVVEIISDESSDGQAANGSGMTTSAAASRKRRKPLSRRK